jgi:hypothetical protein
VLRASGDIKLNKLAVAAVLFKIRAGNDKHDGLAVRRDLRIGDRSDFGVIVPIEVAGLREGGPARGKG